MRRPSLVWFAAVGLVACCGVVAARHASRTLPSTTSLPAPPHSDAATALRDLPLTFERNDGQFGDRVRFAGVQSNGAIAIHDDGFTVAAASGGLAPIALTFAQAQPGSTEGTAREAATVSYFAGADPARWRTGIPTFARVRRADIYPGIDVIYYGSGPHLEYDIVVRPRANPKTIAMDVRGARASIDQRTGDLVLRQRGRELRQRRPVAYQEVGGVRQPVGARYAHLASGRVGFEIDAYDPTRPLTIDPVIVFSTYLMVDDMAVDPAGAIYVVSSTRRFYDESSRADLLPATAGVGSGDSGVHVAKLSADGRTLQFSTFIAAGRTWPLDHVVTPPQIAVDRNGVIYVSAFDSAATAPVTIPSASRTGAIVVALSPSGQQLQWGTYIGNGLQIARMRPRPAGGVAVAGKFPLPFNVTRDLAMPTTYRGWSGSSDAWIAKLSAAGFPESATFLGGSGADQPSALAVGLDDTVYVAGLTSSRDFPVTPGAQQTGLGRNAPHAGFIVRFNAAGTEPIFSSYVGGNEGATFLTGLAVDSHGAAYIAGTTYAEEFIVSAGRTFGACLNANVPCTPSTFLWKLHASGTLAYANKILGQRGFPQGRDIFNVGIDGNAATSPDVGIGATPIALTTADEPVIAFPIYQQVLPLVRSVQPYLTGPLLEGVEGHPRRQTGFACVRPTVIRIAPSDPSVIYAAGPGVCYSRDGGRTWGHAPIDPPMDPTGLVTWISELAVSPADPLTVFAANPERLRKSVDGGVTWTDSGTGLPVGPSRIAFDPNNPSVLFAGDAEPRRALRGIYRSVDGGSSWHVLPWSSDATLDRLDRVAGTSPSTLFVSRWNAVTSEMEYYKSTDGGDTIQLLAGLTAPYATAADPANPLLVYGAFLGKVCRSTDAGVTWPVCNSSGILATFPNSRLFGLAVEPGGHVIHGASHEGFIYSVDDGMTWVQSPLEERFRPFPTVVVDPSRPGRALFSWWPGGDAAIMKFTADGAHVLFSTYFGGTDTETPSHLQLDGAGNIYLKGATLSPAFPTVAPFRGARRADGEPIEYFLTKISMGPSSRGDFDADGRTDIAVFRPSTGEWLRVNSRTGTRETATLGQNGDIPAAADFDGDGQADVAAFRPSSGKWLIRDSGTLQVRTVQWGGTTADIPAPADYDGDGRADIAVFRPSNGYWYILQSATNTPRYVQWGGTTGDIPAAGDYDGDGRADIAFFSPSNGYWYLRRSAAGIQYVQWGGTAADVPAPGDYDGDGKTDVAFWRPSDNYWYIKSSATGAARYVRWGGVPTDVPVPGDYDQDGITDQAFFRPGDGYWYILQSRTRTARYVKLGTFGDIPIPSRR
jgi:hypothetical protein